MLSVTQVISSRKVQRGGEQSIAFYFCWIFALYRMDWRLVLHILMILLQTVYPYLLDALLAERQTVLERSHTAKVLLSANMLLSIEFLLRLPWPAWEQSFLRLNSVHLVKVGVISVNVALCQPIFVVIFAD